MKKLLWGMALLIAIPLNAQFLFINKTGVTIPASGNPQSIGAGTTGNPSAKSEVFYILSDTTWRIDSSQPWLTVLVQLYWSNVDTNGVKKQWVTLGYSGSAPDIGAFEYMQTYATGHDTAIVTLRCEEANTGEMRHGAITIRGADTPIRTLIGTQLGMSPETLPYLVSSIDIDNPTFLEIEYNRTLAGIIPSTSSYTVKSNSVVNNVTSIAVSGTKVILSLANPVVKTDNVTITYFVPTTNKLQSVNGVLADSIKIPQIVKIKEFKMIENNGQILKNGNNIITIKN